MSRRTTAAPESAADLILNELRPGGVDAHFSSALDRVPSTRFDTPVARAAALLASYVIDEANPGDIDIDIAVSIPAARVITFLTQMIDLHGRLRAIRYDNGPEFTCQSFTDWCKEQDIELAIHPIG